jgi:hypothetical protein
MSALTFRTDPPGPLQNGEPNWTIVFGVGLLLLTISFLIHSANQHLSRAVREAELEDAAAEDALGNLDKDVRKRGIKHFKGQARSHMKFFARALIYDAIPLLAVSLAAGYCALALAQKAIGQ